MLMRGLIAIPSRLAVKQLLEAGSDPRLTNTDGLKPVDLLSSSQGEDKVRRLLREAEAVSGMRSSDVVGECSVLPDVPTLAAEAISLPDEDDESDGGPPSDEE